MNVSYFKDFLLLFGTLSIFYGLYNIFPPIAFVALGGFLIFLGWPSREGDKK